MPQKIITLCGSTRFKAAFDEWNARFTLQGHVVLSVALVSTGNTMSEQQKTVLDLVHQKKISVCDEVFVIDIDEYIGESTRAEIDYAHSIRKPVRYLSDEYPGWDESDCEYFTAPERYLAILVEHTGGTRRLVGQPYDFPSREGAHKRIENIESAHTKPHHTWYEVVPYRGSLRRALREENIQP